MSRAFVKEDVEIPERSGRRRSPSGLPPGALNYMTAHGARRFREELARLRGAAGNDSAAVCELERVIASATVVELPQAFPDSIVFGAMVTVRSADGRLDTYRIVGVDEAGLDDGAVSWISPIGKALLGRQIGERVSLGGERDRLVIIVGVEYKEPLN